MRSIIALRLLLGMAAISAGPAFGQVSYVTSYNTDQIFRVENGSSASFGTGLTAPTGLALDASGNLYVADYAGSSEGIWKVTPDGTTSLFSVASRPFALAFDSLGNLYSTSQGGRIYKYSTTGSSTLVASTRQNIAGGIAIDSADNIYIANYSAGSIQTVSSNGTISDFVTGLGNPVDLVISSNGNLFVSLTSIGTVLKITPGGVVTTEVSGLSQPQGLDIDAFNNIYVSDSSGIIKRSPEGASSQIWSGSVNGLGLAVSAVPEPSTYALFGLGALVLVIAARRRAF